MKTASLRTILRERVNELSADKSLNVTHSEEQHGVTHRQATSLPPFRKPAKEKIPLGLLKRAKNLMRELPAYLKQDHREEIKRFDRWLSYKAKDAYYMLTIEPTAFFSAFDSVKPEKE